jgi:C_GCAxxG_C_C family probable redox protein
VFGLDDKTSIKISSGFGAGLGRVQEACGAVTGACMVIGLNFGKECNDAETKQRVYDRVGEFIREFISRNKSISCRTLLGADITTKDGLENTRKQGLFKKVCPGYVRDAVEILEKML